MKDVTDSCSNIENSTASMACNSQIHLYIYICLKGQCHMICDPSFLEIKTLYTWAPWVKQYREFVMIFKDNGLQV